MFLRFQGTKTGDISPTILSVALGVTSPALDSGDESPHSTAASPQTKSLSVRNTYGKTSAFTERQLLWNPVWPLLRELCQGTFGCREEFIDMVLRMRC